MKRGFAHRIKVFLALLSAFALAFSCVPAFAASDGVTLRVFAKGFGALKPVDGTRYVLAQTAESGLWGVINTSGRKLTDYRFENLAHAGGTAFYTASAEEPLENGKALVSLGARLVSDAKYGIIMSYSDNWAAGWVVSEADAEAYDYSPNKKVFYNIEACDVFYLGDEPHMVASYTREEFVTAMAHGQYLSVQDRESHVTVIDSSGQTTGLKVGRVTESVYGIASAALMNKVTREIIVDGLSDAKEIQTRRGLIFQVGRTDFSGKKQYGIVNMAGEWLLPLGDLGIQTVGDDYAVLKENDRVGLYSYDAGKLVIPCAYESIVTNKKSYDIYACYGYVCGVREESRDFISLSTGEVVLTVPESQKNQRIVGPALIQQTTKVKATVQPVNGAAWEIKNMKIINSRGDGKFIVVRSNSDSNYGVYTLDGRIALETKYRSLPVITDDGMIILQTVKEGVQLIQVTWR